MLHEITIGAVAFILLSRSLLGKFPSEKRPDDLASATPIFFLNADTKCKPVRIYLPCVTCASNLQVALQCEGKCRQLDMFEKGAKVRLNDDALGGASRLMM